MTKPLKDCYLRFIMKNTISLYSGWKNQILNFIRLIVKKLQ
ncbi:Uncharacterized protein dnl_62470 [Desulfonema limicola]|uniref:Uncharacterized protein n=1 Tax=Desulfonema limicola TaxID=45656 RepID=A0A975BET5_9BACT|nr:Uncharacterized protein dnl_62470 [Desulfonema limicola]